MIGRDGTLRRRPDGLATLHLSVVAALAPSSSSPLRSPAHGQPAAAPSLSTLLDGWSFDVDVWLPVDRRGAGVLAGRRCASTAGTRPTPCRAGDAGRGSLGLAVHRPRAGLADRALRHDALLRPHGPAPAADDGRRTPAACWRAPITLLLRFASPEARRRWILPVLHSTTRARPVGAAGRVGALRGGHVGRALLARCSTPRWRTRPCTGWSTPCTSARRCCSGGRSSARIRARIGWRIQRGSATCARACRSQSFLGLAIFSAHDRAVSPLRDARARLGHVAARGPGVGRRDHVGRGDLVFVLAIIAAVAVWLRHEDREGKRVDERLERERLARQRAEVAARAE